nr:venom polypeptide precursor [Doratifera vulnerans]
MFKLFFGFAMIPLLALLSIVEDGDYDGLDLKPERI